MIRIHHNRQVYVAIVRSYYFQTAECMQCISMIKLNIGISCAIIMTEIHLQEMKRYLKTCNILFEKEIFYSNEIRCERMTKHFIQSIMKEQNTYFHNMIYNNTCNCRPGFLYDHYYCSKNSFQWLCFMINIFVYC